MQVNLSAEVGSAKAAIAVGGSGGLEVSSEASSPGSCFDMCSKLMN